MCIKNGICRGETWSLWSTTVTPKDWKAVRRAEPRWAVRILAAGRRPDWTTPLAILSAILPAPMKPSFHVSVGIGIGEVADIIGVIRVMKLLPAFCSENQKPQRGGGLSWALLTKRGGSSVPKQNRGLYITA